MATRVLAERFDQLQADEWRQSVGFTPSLHATMERAFLPGASDEAVIALLADWLSQHQPCLFGRIAAKQGLVHYCLLREDDLLASDEAVADKLRFARLSWVRRGWKGEASAFVIAVLSPKLANAKPGPAVREIARRLCALYLLREIEIDQIYLDEIFLEQPGRQQIAWKWEAGVNYFSAQADKRWWQDHRFPAGIAISVNSVGHMVKAGRLAHALEDLELAMGCAMPDFRTAKIESLEKAIEMAMRTIALASDAPSGKATSLLPRSEKSDYNLICPVKLPAFLEDKDYRSYRGLYHTDVTLPSEYFVPDVEKPIGFPVHVLDFTYLFDKSRDNPAHVVMGAGLQIRHDTEQENEPGVSPTYPSGKRGRAMGVEIAVAHAPVLIEALGCG